MTSGISRSRMRSTASEAQEGAVAGGAGDEGGTDGVGAGAAILRHAIGRAGDDEDVAVVRGVVIEVGGFLLEVTFYAAADGGVELGEVADFHAGGRHAWDVWDIWGAIAAGRAARDVRSDDGAALREGAHLFEVREVALGVESGGAALAGGGDGLAVGAVGDVAGGEDAGDVGVGAVFLEEIALVIHVELAAEGGGIGGVADGDEDALEFESRGAAGDEIGKVHGADLVLIVGEVAGDGGVPDGLDLGIAEGAVGHDLRGAELIAAMDEVNLRGEPGEEAGFLARGIAAADDGDRDVAIEGAVAGGAGGEAVADEFALALDAEPAGGGAAGDDEGAGVDPLGVVELEADVVAPSARRR